MNWRCEDQNVSFTLFIWKCSAVEQPGTRSKKLRSCDYLYKSSFQNERICYKETLQKGIEVTFVSAVLAAPRTILKNRLISYTLKSLKSFELN